MTPSSAADRPLSITLANRSRLSGMAAAMLLCLYTAGTAMADVPAADPDPNAAPDDAPDSQNGRNLQAPEEVVVSADIATTARQSRDNLQNNPGGTAFIASEDLDKGRLSNAADVLAGQAGVVAQSNNGGEATRLSIRGSGIQRAASAFEQGVNLLQNGLSLRTSSGFPYEGIEPLAVSYVEVLRGVSAFDYGPTTIGGTINYVHHTGYDSAPLELRTEAGSYGYFKQQVSSGQVLGPLDYYGSLTDYRYSGYRDGSTSRSSRAIFDVGYQVNPSIVTRFFFLAAEQFQENPGSLTWSQLQTNPYQSQFPQLRNRQNPWTFNVGNTTTIQTSANSSLELSDVYLVNPNTNPGGPAPNFFDFRADNGSIRFRVRNDLFGLQSKTTLSFISNNQLYADQRARNSNAAGAPDKYLSKTVYRANDAMAIASNELGLRDDLWLTTGVAYLWQVRKAYNVFPLNQTVDRYFRDVVGRAGLRFDFTPNINVFIDGGRVVEAPYSSGLALSNAAGTVTSLLQLKSQPAETVEVGTRGTLPLISWDVELYHSWVKNELITNLIAPTVSATSNASPTIHEGVELSLNTLLWQSGDDWQIAPSGAATSPQVQFRQVYTANRFHYKDDPTYNTNALAGVPRNIYNAELVYQHPSGFYVGADAEASLTRYPIDYANTYFARSYAIFGARIGYSQFKKGWTVFAQLENLANRRYASIVAPILNASGKDAAVFTPGTPRSVYGGLSYRF